MCLFPKPILGALVLVLLVGVAPVSAQAKTVYVNGCNPLPGDGSPSNPYNTLTRAVTKATPRSTLIVQGGSYPERLTIPKKLTLTASGGPVLVGEYFVGTQEICVLITQREGALVDEERLVNCADNPPGVHAKLYYPAAAPGEAPVACGGPFPLIVYAHGRRSEDQALCEWSNPGPIYEDYRQAEGILTRLAASGMMVISVDVTWSDLDEWGKSAILVNTLTYARDENARPGSRLEGAVDLGRVGLMGHSTGGSAALRVAACLQGKCSTDLTLPKVQVAAVGLLAPGLPYTVKVADLQAPLLVIHGTNDTEQVGDDPLEVYGSANPPKHLVVVTGANHFGYTDDICLEPGSGPFDDTLSEVGGVTGQEAHARQQQTARNYADAFFSYYLLGDVTQLDYLLQQSGQQCDHPGNPPTCGFPRRSFDDLDQLNVEVSVCSCVP